MKREPPYTLRQALKIARHFEKQFKPNYHIALGGSVLHAGKSQKDIDLYIYPDSNQTVRGVDAREIMHELKRMDASIERVLLGIPMKEGYTNKPLIQMIFKGYPIDLFFIAWESI